MPTSRTRSATAFLRRHGIILAIAVVATTTVAATAAQAGTTADLNGQGTSHASRVLHFGVQFSPQNVIDVPPLQQHDGDYQPGDYVVFSDVLTNRAAHPVGTEGGSGLITQVNSTTIQLYYSLAIQIPGGQLTAQGLSSPAPAKRLAITGGTGVYTGAAGSLDLIENGDGTGSLTLTLR
jgi:hypothetical protein